MMAEVRKIKKLMQGKPVNTDLSDESEYFTLTLTIKEARNLPKMDVLHGIDCYCVVTVEDLQEEVYQTKVVLKNRCALCFVHVPMYVCVYVCIVVSSLSIYRRRCIAMHAYICMCKHVYTPCPLILIQRATLIFSFGFPTTLHIQ
jgi:hypothetical protein